jgi:hypothetical protein
MKSVLNCIQEKLVIKKNKEKEKIVVHCDGSISQLRNFYDIVHGEIKKYGKEADLNHIDVSNVKSFEELFLDSDFDGDISKWDVSNAENMDNMFCGSSFSGENGDISNWDVSNVKNMRCMFKDSWLNLNLENWKVNKKCDMDYMFWGLDIEDNPPKWFNGKFSWDYKYI